MFNNDDKIDCNKILNHILHDKEIIFLGKGTYGIVFKGFYDNKYISIKFITKKNKYNNDNTHPANIEYNLGKKLKDIILNKKISPHINDVYKYNDCNINYIKNQSLLNNEYYKLWYKDTKKLLKKEAIYSEIKIIYGELANTDLKKFVLENYQNLDYNDHLILFFQFCYTLTCIQYYIKNFKHNDIKPNNILIKFVENINDNEFNEYILFKKKYYLPRTKYILKIYDLDMAYGKEFKNSKVKNSYKSNLKNVGLSNFYNSVYDLHEYMNFYLRDFKDDKLPKQVVDLFKTLIPKNCLGKNNINTYNYKLVKYKFDKNNDNNKNDDFFKKNINYVPKNMKSPAELFLYSNIFNKFTKLPKDAKIINSYNSKTKLYENLFRRYDMFNMHLIN